MQSAGCGQLTSSTALRAITALDDVADSARRIHATVRVILPEADEFRPLYIDSMLDSEKLPHYLSASLNAAEKETDLQLDAVDGASLPSRES